MFEGTALLRWENLPARVKAYKIGANDYEVIGSVKSTLSGNDTDPFFIDQQCALLESVIRKFSIIIAAEANSGIMNWNLREQVGELRILLGQLQHKRRGLFAAD